MLECSKVHMECKICVIYSLPVLLAPLLLIPFTTEEIIGCTYEAAQNVSIAPS